jgi:hypothetical protein
MSVGGDVLHIPWNDNIMKCKFIVRFARRVSEKYQVMPDGQWLGGSYGRYDCGDK